LAQLGDLYATAPEEVMPNALAMLARNWVRKAIQISRALLSAAVRALRAEACTRRKYKAVAELCYSLKRVAQRRPAWCRISAPASASKIACPR